MNDGGPAFPSTIQYFPDDKNADEQQGMTLRDYFAAKAMKYMGLPTKVHATGRIGENIWELREMDDFPYEDMAKIAYRWADAMLAARGQK